MSKEKRIPVDEDRVKRGERKEERGEERRYSREKIGMRMRRE